MSASEKFRRLFRLDRGTRDVDAEVNDEFSFHFEMTMRELLASGMPKEAAEREAMRRFGDVDAARVRVSAIDRDRVGQARRVERWGALVQDLRYSVRGLKANPMFTAGVVLTLGLGVGANATMFGIVDRLLFRAPAFLASPDRVGRVYLMQNSDGRLRTDANLSYQRYLDLRANTSSFDALTPYFESDFIVGDGQDARELPIVMAGAEFWPMFTARPVIGRSFTPAEDAMPAGARVAVLGYGFWQSHFGASPDVLGQEIRIGGQRYRIIGVAPRGFNGLSLRSIAAFVPLTALARAEFGDFDRGYGFSWMGIVGRRKPDVSAEAAGRDLGLGFVRSIQARFAGSSNPPDLAVIKPRAEFGSVLEGRGPRASAETRVALWLFGVTGIVLLIAAANVAGLLLARSIRRRREIAIRIALGVGRARLFAMLIVECLVLAALGAAAGLIVADWGGRILRLSMMPDIDWTPVLRDGHVLGIACAAAAGCAVLAGFAPLLHASRTDLADAMRGGNREGGAARSRLRDGLLLFQAALSVVLLVGAGLFVGSLRNAKHLALGYEPDHVVYVSIDNRGYDFAPGVAGPTRDSIVTETLLAQRQRLLAAARAIPGVESAAVTYGVPFWATLEPDVYVPGVDSVSRLGSFVSIGVSGDYFRTMGTRVIRGRPITDADMAATARFAVVSQEMAAALWPGQDPLGKCFKVQRVTAPCSIVIGVVEGIVRGSMDGDPKLQFYMPIDQLERGRGSLYIRTSRPGRETFQSVRAELQKQLRVPQYANGRSLSSILDPNLRQWNLGATMFTFFGILALTLAAVGLYSVVSYSVAQRKHEIGVRIALGAGSRDVVGMVFGEGMRLMLLGLAIGVAIALFAAPLVGPMLYHVDPRDPTIFVAVAVVLLAVAALATMLPAIRATRVDPQEALRAE